MDSITLSNNSYHTASDDVTIDLGGMYAPALAYNIGSISITSSGSGEYHIPFAHPSGQWQPPVPFDNMFPDWDDFQNMCAEYPGLQKVYEHMKVYYSMCKDDWATKKNGDAG